MKATSSTPAEWRFIFMMRTMSMTNGYHITFDINFVPDNIVFNGLIVGFFDIDNDLCSFTMDEIQDARHHHILSHLRREKMLSINGSAHNNLSQHSHKLWVNGQ